MVAPPSSDQLRDWAVPRYSGRSRSALVELQADEYGNGVPGAAHAELFVITMESLGLDNAHGAHLDRLPGITLATTNLVSMFGIHRRWLPALLGHLALFEMTTADDMIFSDGTAGELLALTGSLADGYRGTISVGIRTP